MVNPKMRFEVWEPVYREILSDFGYSRLADESSARLLKSLMINADLLTIEELGSVIGDKVSILGAGDNLRADIEHNGLKGTLISAGSATKYAMDMGIVPDIVVTDLDGDIDSQLEASEKGAITVIHAHGDNTELIIRYAKEFKGKVAITTQSVPDNIIYNFGGFTDGDRSVCMADHFGASFTLYGFDFDNPSETDEKEASVKKKKLMWAKKIIGMIRR